MEWCAQRDRHRPDRLRGAGRTAAEEVDRRFARGLTIEPETD